MNSVEYSRKGPESSPTGNKASILLFLVPIAELAVVFIDGIHFPINQPRFLAIAAIVASILFALLWRYAFRGCPADWSLKMTTAFLFLLWSIAGIPFIAWLNEAFDESPPQKETRGIVRTQRHGGGVRSRAVCSIWLNRQIAGIDVLSVRADYCEIISPGIDGLEAQVRAGALGFPWLGDFAIIKDFSEFRSMTKK